MLPRFTKKPVDHPLGFVVAIAAGCMQLMSYGIDNNFSTFTRYMHNDASLGHPSVTQLSFGNSISLGLSPVFGIFAGFLADRVPSIVMMLSSTALLFLGLWLSSTVATNTAGVICSYSLLVSVSSAAMLAPGAATTGSWFNKRRGLAMGINFCGGGVGSSFIPAIVGKWAERYGWRKTFRLMSSFCAIGLVASFFCAKRREPEEQVEALDDAEPLALGEEVYREYQSRNASKHAAEDGSLDAFAHESSIRRAVRLSHTRKLNGKELFFAFLSPEFLANFMMFLVFGWTFYGLIYIMVPYVSSMGDHTTVYAEWEPISIAKASTMFTYYGVCQILGSIAFGALASATSDELAYCLCSCLGGITAALLACCRCYAAFAADLCILGFCIAGIFAIMPSLIAKRLYGPNLGLFMSSVFVAGCVGGFSAPPMQALMQSNNRGSYTQGCIIISVCMTVPGIICYVFFWEKKRLGISRWFGKQLRAHDEAKSAS